MTLIERLIQFAASFLKSLTQATAMNSVMLVSLTPFLLWAAYLDVRYRRIPNGLILGGALIGTMLAGLHGEKAVLDAAGGCIAGTMVLTPFYLLRGMAAGDIKLMGMAGIFLGAEGVVRASLYAFVAGGVLALAWLIVLKFKPSSAPAKAVLKDVAVDNGIATAVRQHAHLFQTDREAFKRLPYAIAITTGIGVHFIFLAGIPRLAV